MGNFTVYSSSAGSGKTYTLVREYLRLALSNEDPSHFRHILAMTFTNKAASEMKSRVIEALQMISEGPKAKRYDSGLVEQLCSANELSKAELQLRATNTLKNLMHNYSDLSISTIDKFTHKVIRTFARDLHLTSDFEIHMNTDDLLQRTVDSLIAQAGEDEKLTEVLVQFTFDKTDSDKSWKVENDMFEFSKNLLKEDAEDYLNQLRGLDLEQLTAIRNELAMHIKIFEEQCKKIGQRGLTTIENAGVQHDRFFKGADYIPKAFVYLNEQREYDKVLDKQKYFDADNWYAGKATAQDKIAIDSIKDALTQTYYEAHALLIGELQTYRVYTTIHRQFYALSLIHELETVVNNIKEEQNILLIADFNKKISGIVRNEPVPFIYERLGEKYHHYLLDEFQDTSLLQWQNLIPLLENSLANGNFNLVVGDGKQAIYRWRNGEVEQFITLPKLYNVSGTLKEKEEAFVRNHKPEKLDKNWRSKREIVEFNNRLFEHLSPKLLNPHLAKVYDGLAQKFDKNNTGGYVNFEFLSAEKATDQHYLEATINLVNQAIDDGYRYRDIAIICRINHHASLVANYLLQHKIPVISSESLLVNSNDSVKLIIATMRYLSNQSDQDAKLAIMRNYHRNSFTEGEVFNYVQRQNRTITVDLAAFLKDQNIELRHAAMQEMPVYELVEELVRIYGLKTETNPYLLFFLDAVHNFATRESCDMVEFLSWWNDNHEKIAIKVPDRTNAIEILTIHKSKGLQFPVVIVPFTNWKMKRGNDTIWVQPTQTDLPVALVSASKSQLEGTEFEDELKTEDSKTHLDHLNMLYVAFTRPKDRLYVISDQKSGSDHIRHYLLGQVKQYPEFDHLAAALKIGKRTKPQLEREEEIKHYTLSKCHTASWKEQLHLSLRAPAMWDLDQPESATRFGTLMHTALARIEREPDAPRVLEQMLLEGLIDLATKNELQSEIHSLFTLQQMKDWFSDSATAYAESEILGNDGSIIRPDRVIIKAKTAQVIDFKTGKESDEHMKQITEYGSKLKEIGYTDVKQFLVYTTDKKIVEVCE